MDLELHELQEDYCRWRDKIGEDIYLGPKTIGILDVLHYLIVDFFATEYGEGVGGVGPKDLNLLHSTLSRQTSMYGNISKWTDNFEIWATLFWGLIKNHAFHDASAAPSSETITPVNIQPGRFACMPCSHPKGAGGRFFRGSQVYVFSVV